MAKTPLKKAGPETTNKRAKREVDDDDGDDIGSAGKSKADLFDETKPNEGFGIPQGAYEALIVGAELKRDESSEKESIEMTYEVINHRDDELNGKTVKAWYNLFDKDGTPAKGGGFWKRDSAVIGYECKYADLEETLAGLVEDQVEVAITVKVNGQFTNIYLNGLVNN